MEAKHKIIKRKKQNVFHSLIKKKCTDNKEAKLNHCRDFFSSKKIKELFIFP